MEDELRNDEPGDQTVMPAGLPMPTETTTFRPLQIGVNVSPDGDVSLLLVIAPRKYVEVIIDAQAAVAVREQMPPSASALEVVTKPKILLPG